MDPPPLPHLSAAVAAATQLNYQDSVDSSPRSHNADTWDDPLPPVPVSKLRLMCSYGGHIIPRPHDKSLCYVGGETRIVVVDRHCSLSDLCMRLSRSLLNGRPFTLKYQLPHEDLDSLISVATDEDLDNMIEEYDRINLASPLKPLSLRLFLFFTKPETAASMGSLLDDAKHETWFVDALNNSVAIISRGLSDSATMDCVVNLDAVRGNGSDSCNDLEKQVVVKNRNSSQDVQSVENNSSFGSTSSSPSMSNLPPIRVRVEDMKNGLEEQFLHMNFAQLTVPSSVFTNHTAVSSENTNRVSLDDEKLDQGGQVGFRKPPLPLQTLQSRTATGHVANAGFSLPSPDSVTSDSSIASANSQSKPMYYQEQILRDNTAPAIPIAESDGYQLTSSQFPIQQLHHDSSYLLTSQLMDQKQPHQFVQTTAHYIHHHHPAAAGHVPVPSYYPVYAPQAQQQLHHPIDQQYPVYIMPITQTQHAYNMPLQSNTSETPLTAPNRPQPSPNPALVSAYSDGNQPPLYHQKAASPTLPEMTAGAYRTAATSTPPPLLHVPHNQFQQPYIQMNYPSQSMAVASSGTPNYGYDYTATTTSPVQNITGASTPSQYQTMTPAAAAALSDASNQLPADATQQQIRNS